MTDHDPERSLQAKGDDLNKRLRKARQIELGTSRKEPKLSNEKSGLGQAFRMSTELISALLVGVGLGWGLDKLLDTKPWMMIICIFLGGAAGILNVYNTAMRMADDLNADLKEDLKETGASGATNGNDTGPEGRQSPEK